MSKPEPERSGDVGERNAGMLSFVVGRERPEFVPWTEIEQIDLDRPTVPSVPAVEVI